MKTLNKCKWCNREIRKKQINQDTCSITCTLLYRSSEEIKTKKTNVSKYKHS